MCIFIHVSSSIYERNFANRFQRRGYKAKANSMRNDWLDFACSLAIDGRSSAMANGTYIFIKASQEGYTNSNHLSMPLSAKEGNSILVFRIGVHECAVRLPTSTEQFSHCTFFHISIEVNNWSVCDNRAHAFPYDEPRNRKMAFPIRIEMLRKGKKYADAR